MQVVSPAQYDKKSVNPSYSRLSEAFRHVTAGPLQCQVFCGGRSCKYERSDVWTSDQMAIPGLFSHWVTDSILAMARPNYTEMKRHNMIEEFKKAGIGAVINLQEGGEHASCGNPLHSSGFSYDPLELMNNGIFYYNFNIQDYSVPLQRTLLDICKVVAFSQQEGSVAIHCHAGLGRTGVVIACFLVYSHKMKPKDAILLVRKNRPRSIQTRNQLKAVFKFAMFLAPLWAQFPQKELVEPHYNLEEIVCNQKVVLHGLEARTLKYLPKLLYMACSWVLKLVGLPTTLLVPKIQRHLDERPYQASLQFDEDNDDLDSVVGEDALCNVNEVEEMEELMIPKQPLLKRVSSGDTMNSQMEKETKIDQEEVKENIVLKELTEEGSASLRSFLDNLCDGDKTTQDELDDVILQINAGTWNVVEGLEASQLGALLRRWFLGLAKPALGELQAELLHLKCGLREEKDLDRIKEAFDTLTTSQIGTFHCLATTFAVLLHGPIQARKTDLLMTLEYLLTQQIQVVDEGEEGRIRQLLAALIEVKQRELFLHPSTKS